MKKKKVKAVTGSTNADAVGLLLRHNVRDSVFTNLFRHEEYVRQLYHALHPEVDPAEQEPSRP